MIHSEIISPITSNKKILVERRLKTKVIIEDYKIKYGVDVSRHFKECPNELLVCRCIETDYRFYYPFSVAGDGQFYNDVLEKNAYYPTWKKEYQVALEYIKKLEGKIKVLDVGCGNGTFLNGIKEKDVELIGLEFNDAAIETCRKAGIEVLKTPIEEFSRNNTEQFDVVTVFQVLEHVADIKPFIDACLACLKPGGMLVISVPNNGPYYGGYNSYATANLPPHHMGLWNIVAFRKLENYFPFKLKSFEYDLKISFFRSVFYRGQFHVNNWKPELKNTIGGKLLSATISLIYLPLEYYKQKILKKILFGRVITIFNKNK